VKGFARSPRLVRFEGFQLDLRAGELRPDAGKTLRLSEQPFRILTMLLERPGEVLTREEIRKELWPDNTIVEFEHSINAAMNRLRQALGDSGDHPRYIETLARRGYRWMVSVEGMEVRPTPDVTPRRWWPWAAALVAAMGLGAGILWFVRPALKIPEPRLTVTPLTASPGDEDEPSFSPDGNQVAFVRHERNQEGSQIYVKLIGTGGPPLRLTTGPVSDYSPAWSPDGRYIAFLRYLSREKKAAVMLIPALGGPERKIAEVFQSALFSCTFLTWSPDGNSLVVSDRDTPKQPTGLFLLAIDTGEKRRLTSPASPAMWDWSGDTCPSLSPDGRTLAFSRTVDESADLYLLTVSDGLKAVDEPKRIALGNLRAYAPVWTEDGREIVFSNISLSRAELWRIDVSGSARRSAEPQRLAALGENSIGAAISRRGHRLAYTSFSTHSSIWRIAAPGGSKARDEESARSVNGDTPFIYSTRDDTSPQFSPDGKRIAFMSTRSGDLEIWVCDSDGSNPVQLTSFRDPNVSTPRWSPDGGRIAFDSDAEGKQYDIWVINAGGGKPKRMTTDPANDGNPSWSRDGRWIYFDSYRTGEQQVWKIPEAGGDAIQVTREGGFAPLESPDGKFIYYTKGLVDTSVWRLPVEGGQPTKVLERLSIYLNLAIVDEGIYFVPQQVTALAASIEFLDFTTNHTKRIASFGKFLSNGLALSPDGRWILYVQDELGSAELRLVENFH
jgi:Tol biopolymer transport system component/DNA-binding winged helix-turn-helix (wHTH) protein